MVYLLGRARGGGSWLDADAAGAVVDAGDDELGRGGKCQADVRHYLACVANLCRIGLAVALDEERLLRAAAVERTAVEQPVEVGGQLAHDADPQAHVIRLVSEIGHEVLDPAA